MRGKIGFGGGRRENGFGKKRERINMYM